MSLNGARLPLEKLLTDYVEPGGRVILRSYFKILEDGSREDTYFDIAAWLNSLDIEQAGMACSDPPGSLFG